MSVDEKQVESEVIRLIGEQLGVEVAQITSTTSIVNDLGADSLDFAELMIKFEETFDIDINEEKAQGITTVGEVVSHVVESIKSKS
ncbi:MAG: acyl carrier protein [Planctomycetaceae bacterium]|jgi:acyl carrier protein|nr:acyl carrier protein [Planctomycetaceae bacterium]